MPMPAGHEHHERVRRSVDGVHGNAGSFMPPFRPRRSASNERSRITRPYDASSSWRNCVRIDAAGGRGRRTQLHYRTIIVVIEIDDLVPRGIHRGRDAEDGTWGAGVDLEQGGADRGAQG